jgi:hypothetical protein
VDVLLVTASNARKGLINKGSKKIVFIIRSIFSDFLKPIWEIIHLPATCRSHQGKRANSICTQLSMVIYLLLCQSIQRVVAEVLTFIVIILSMNTIVTKISGICAIFAV